MYRYLHALSLLAVSASPWLTGAFDKVNKSIDVPTVLGRHRNMWHMECEIKPVPIRALDQRRNNVQDQSIQVRVGTGVRLCQVTVVRCQLYVM